MHIQQYSLKDWKCEISLNPSYHNIIGSLSFHTKKVAQSLTKALTSVLSMPSTKMNCKINVASSSWQLSRYLCCFFTFSSTQNIKRSVSMYNKTRHQHKTFLMSNNASVVVFNHTNTQVRDQNISTHWTFTNNWFVHDWLWSKQRWKVTNRISLCLQLTTPPKFLQQTKPLKWQSMAC